MSFASQVKKGADQYMIDAMKVVSDSYLNTSDKVITRTAVLTGKLKNNWSGSFGSPSVVNRNTSGFELGSSGADSFDSAKRVAKLIDPSKVGKNIYLTNGLDYAEDIEMGKSGKSPRGMLRVSVREAGGTYK